MRVLVVGASGILAPAARELAARGARVTGVGRTRPMPDGVDAVHLDARDAAAVRQLLRSHPADAAIVYGRALSLASLDAIERAVPRVVHVRSSAAADPAQDPMLVAPLTLQLGWTNAKGGPRWHDPEEVSAAALQVLEDGAGRVLGTVRPWKDRP